LREDRVKRKIEETRLEKNAARYQRNLGFDDGDEEITSTMEDQSRFIYSPPVIHGRINYLPSCSSKPRMMSMHAFHVKANSLSK